MHFNSSNFKIVVIIPARYESSRLPGKPLINLLGVPMIVRTFRQCAKVIDSNDIYVATDDHRIKSVCESFGIKALITSSKCLTGTDRIAEVTKLVDADIYINMQGDEPLMNPLDILTIKNAALKYPNLIINGFCEIKDEQQFRNINIPKVVFREDGRLLYMSRASIPTNKSSQFIRSFRQVCIYAFPKKTLEAFSSRGKKTLFEEIEDIEILRFVEMGFDVKMIELSADSISVDVPEDVVLVEARLKSYNNL